MPTQYKTPGVYIVEKNAFPPSVVAVETAVPAFVGYTRYAEFKGKPLTNVPFRLSSMTEFEAAFGGPPTPRFRITGPGGAGAKTPGAALSGPGAAPAAAPLAIADAASPTEAEVDAIKAAAAASSDLADEQKAALAALAAGTSVTAEQTAALAELNQAGAAPAAGTALAAPGAPLAIADPAKPKATEIAAIKAAVTGATTLAEGNKTALAGLTVGTAMTTEQTTALVALNQALAPAPAEPAASNARDRGWTFKVNKQDYKVERTDTPFLLYYAMRQFFDNGGGPCWIVSVGNYDDGKIELGDDDTGLKAGIGKLKDEMEPTMLIIPDAVRLNAKECISLQQAMLLHCGYDMKNRFAILDVHDGDQPIFGGDSPVDAFRSALGVNNLNFGAAYYPWLNTTVVQDRDLGYANFLDPDDLETSTSALLALVDAGHAAAGEDAAFKTKRKAIAVSKSSAGANLTLDAFLKLPAPVEPTGEQAATISQVNQLLVATSDAFTTMRTEALRQLNLLPPSGAMAGLYTFVDNSRGVWKAPANISVNGAVSPAVPISALAQQGLNVDPMGKSINAIRSFIGEGVLVWGARTLDGNSLDWRYINVRRTMIFLEESCKLAAKRMVFEPNVSSTWVTIKAMIENFLTSVWRQGGLAGAVPADAFSVHVGLGDTMTADDILEGILRVTVLVAISRPAEFIEITFQQQLQKS